MDGKGKGKGKGDKKGLSLLKNQPKTKIFRFVLFQEKKEKKEKRRRKVTKMFDDDQRFCSSDSI